MSKADYLIIALGNPGAEYELTRHNIGWIALDGFMADMKVEFTINHNYAQIAELKFAGKQIVLAKPLTYMNLSGKAAKIIIRDYGISPSNVICMVDEYNFPLGKVHLKQSGSDGGHNGLKSMIEELGTPNFYRMRLGIEKNFGLGGLVDYVLGKFNPEEMAKLPQIQEDTTIALKHLLKVGLQRAMSDINSAKMFKKPLVEGGE